MLMWYTQKMFIKCMLLMAEGGWTAYYMLSFQSVRRAKMTPANVHACLKSEQLKYIIATDIIRTSDTSRTWAFYWCL